MRILLLGDINSVHLMRWATGLSDSGIEVGIWSLATPVNDWYSEKSIRFFSSGNSGAKKFSYFFSSKSFKNAMKEFNPDLIHAHYASSYGFIARRSKFHPFILSFWGSDILSFPRKSILHRLLIKNNISAADFVLATSDVMRKEIAMYSDKNVTLTPFGIDTNKFSPIEKKHDDHLTIGCVKAMEDTYGIDILIKVFSVLRRRFPRLKLMLTGDGSRRKVYEGLCRDSGIENDVIFTGKVDSKDLPLIFGKMHIAAFLSRSESFGVAALEASSCGLPVVASDIGGLPEVVIDTKTGFLVDITNEKEIISRFEKLIIDADLRTKMGEAGRKFVQENYEWKNNLHQMIEIYKEAIR